jgi:hypothetical protein
MLLYEIVNPSCVGDNRSAVLHTFRRLTLGSRCSLWSDDSFRGKNRSTYNESEAVVCER